MIDFYSECPGCEAAAGTSDLDAYPSARVEHYECEACGCEWEMRYKLTDQSRLIKQEGEE